MIKPNWNIFKAKFSENPEYNFEWFCYLLFCKEYNRKFGVFRYINQAAIETEPIKVDDEVIGWQAKFYDVALSDRKDTILSTIEKSKKYYPSLTKLIFYTNQEWGQTKGKKPKGLIEIEKKLKELNIVLEWRTASFFESEFVVNDNKLFSKHFFMMDKSVFDLLEEQKKHTENVLNGIHSNIIFNDQNIEITRNKYVEDLKENKSKILILSGAGGVGKTAIIKKLYGSFNQVETPLFVFKATEFELRHINDLVSNFSIYDFAEITQELDNKTIVIDSAEKLLDLKNTDPFKEFLSIVIRDKWQILFTTRTHYLENLYTDLSEIYNVTPLKINIDVLDEVEINQLSEEYSFSLPKDERLLTLIKNPFYLNAYLKNYSNTNELDYSAFKTKLWNKEIKKSQPERERCFFNTVKERITSGQFFISLNCESGILHELVKDGILGYEEKGYFITHDIYEEWALEKIIEIEYAKRTDELDFFDKIGQSLAMRRSFRNWLSEKLLLEDESMKSFIEEVVENSKIAQFWKDELFTSILLSDYSEVFFELFKVELLENEQNLLKRITFILRMSCKDIDNDFFMQLGIKNLNIFSLKYVMTKPKGKGWEYLIQFVFNNIKNIGIKNINFILPIIHDWNSKVHYGEITRFSSLIALQFYEWIMKEDIYWSKDDMKYELFKTIINGSSEIKDELEIIFKKVLKHEWKQHSDPYSDFMEFLLTKFEAYPLVKNLPTYILKIADLFWTYTPQDEDMFYRSSIEVEQYFGLENNRSDYHPASAYQTPIFWSLNSALRETVDFILEFVNKSVENYANSGFDNSVKKVKIYINENTIHEQYISHCLWCMYRGTGSPISPYLLQSIHMSLEKYFLEIGKKADARTLENWLIYLLENSNSASISAVVSSVVTAYPDKTFNVAQILFKTKEFIQQDTSRLVVEKDAESLYSIGKNWGVNTNELHDNERIQTCKDKHRKVNLENLFLQYQFFRNEGVSEEEAEQRQKILWEVLDNYYEELNAFGDDKTWRIFLARMDKRKMNPTLEKANEGVIINFNPELDSDIKEYSENSIAETTDLMKHIPLKLWSENKFKNDEKYKQYSQYEENPKLALDEVRNILEEFDEMKSNNNGKTSLDFSLFNKSIPIFVCCVLVRDYMGSLNNDEKTFCKEMILETAIFSLKEDYQYQISDGVQEVFSVLPILFEIFPNEYENIKSILFFGLFKNEHVGGMLEDAHFNVFSIIAINSLWEKYFEDAQSILFGYIILKPLYDEIVRRIREESYSKRIQFSQDRVWDLFFEENEEIFSKVIESKLNDNDLKNINQLDLYTLKTVFQIIPVKTENVEHKKIVKILVDSFAKALLSKDGHDKVDYSIRHAFFEKYVYFVLNLPQNEIQYYLDPFINQFNKSEIIADLLKEFVIAEDNLNTYDNFWFIWNVFKGKIFKACENGDGIWYMNKIVRSYLFAEVLWKESAKEWRSFKDKDKKFFKEVCESIGHCPATLYSVSKVLNDIGTPYLEYGIIWLSKIFNDNDYMNKKLEINTIYYLEYFLKKYIYKYREKIRTTKNLKDKVVVILNFLIEKGSVVGYMLREKIL